MTVDISWGYGTKSFFEVLSREPGHGRRPDLWMEAKRGKELSGIAVGIAYLATLYEAQQNPEREYHISYFNSEYETKENPYNAPFRAENNWEKPDLHEGMTAIAAMALLKLSQYHARKPIEVRPLKRQSWVTKRPGQRYVES